MKKQHLTLPNKETIHFIEEGANNEEVFVLIHGNQSSSVHHKPLIDLLKTKYHIIAPDMRGFGDSTYHEKINSIDDFCDDTLALLELLNIKKYHLLGWSTGGGVAMKMAAKKPEEVEKLVLVESCSHRGYPIFKKDENGQAVIGSYYSTIDELATDPVQVAPLVVAFGTQNKALIDMIWDAAIYTASKPSKEDNELYLTETMKQRNIVEVLWSLTTFNMSSHTNGLTLGDNSIKNIVCPVLSIWGDKDAVVLEYMVDETVEAINDIKKVVFEDSGHSPYVDHPEELAKTIKEFLSQ
jgi:pimeloyl-ACP methyl ester carboxylesterase